MAARDEETGGGAGTEQISEGRRRLLAALAIGGGGTLLTQQWAKPIVDLVIVPLHAQASNPPCATTGVMTCGGITFVASAVFIAGVECKGGSAFSACCDQVVWKKPSNGSHRARLSLSHSYGQTLSVKVDFFTFSSNTCTNSSSFGDTSTNDIAAGQTFVFDGNINGDFPECVGFRIAEVKVTSSGNEITACKGNCGSAPVDGDLGIYATILAADAACPP